MTNLLRAQLAASLAATDPTLAYLTSLDQLLTGLAQFGAKYRGPEYVEAMEDARRQVALVRESAMRAVIGAVGG